ncbi:tyrosine-type recombinase/integrase [Pantoea dispersa]|uniref:tyrosine-type recombinase/integrase n=1 Tax=Pantoea dispersa TaxID=59814 RepID=UPI0023A98D70|nr:tyrosine-type recombinase/integrase [Pantoea dispersa]WEA06423.1 tyrosine-type recombinase/integrase [Pantoea dispersa]
MHIKKDSYLATDPSGVWIVRIAIPPYMKLVFGGKSYFIRSTGTADIRKARLFRDRVATEFNNLREQLRPKETGSRVEKILNELRQISVTAKDAPPIMLNAQQVKTCPSLLNMRDVYLLQFSEKRKLTTLSKTNKAVEVLLSHLRKRDIQLRDINRTVVTGWLDNLNTEKAPQTIQNYVSALAQIWDLARNRYHDAPQDNPWCGHGLEAKNSKVVTLVESLLQTPSNGFICYRASITDRADGKRSTWHTQRFKRAKRKALGATGTDRKVFHSLRHEFAQQLDRAMVSEDRIALLMGHERGKTESFKTYSKFGSVKELAKYVELIQFGLT